MKIDKIIFMETIPTGSFANVKMGLEIQLTEGDLVEDAYRKAKSIVNETFHRLYNNVESGFISPDYNGQPIAQKPHNSVIDRSIERLEIMIDDCKTIDDLVQVSSQNPKIFDNKTLTDLYAHKVSQIRNNQ